MSVRAFPLAAVAVAVAFAPLPAAAVQPVDRLSAHLQSAAVPVTVNNYVLAETAGQFDRILKMTGGINKLQSFRQPH